MHFAISISPPHRGRGVRGVNELCEIFACQIPILIIYLKMTSLCKIMTKFVDN